VSSNVVDPLTAGELPMSVLEIADVDVDAEIAPTEATAVELVTLAWVDSGSESEPPPPHPVNSALIARALVKRTSPNNLKAM
jgi:hypothetical protein